VDRRFGLEDAIPTTLSRLLFSTLIRFIAWKVNLKGKAIPVQAMEALRVARG
jgi:hypothetical protein